MLVIHATTLKRSRVSVGTLTPPPEGVTVNPTQIQFTVSEDQTWVTAYEARYYIVSGGSGLHATQDLGLPTPVDGTITISIDTGLFTPSSSLAYEAHLVAISDEIESDAAVSNTFMFTS